MIGCAKCGRPKWLHNFVGCLEGGMDLGMGCSKFVEPNEQDKRDPTLLPAKAVPGPAPEGDSYETKR